MADPKTTTKEWRSMDMPFFPGPQFWHYPKIEIRDDRTGVTTIHEVREIHPAMNV